MISLISPIVPRRCRVYIYTHIRRLPAKWKASLRPQEKPHQIVEYDGLLLEEGILSEQAGPPNLAELLLSRHKTCCAARNSFSSSRRKTFHQFIVVYFNPLSHCEDFSFIVHSFCWMHYCPPPPNRNLWWQLAEQFRWIRFALGS